VKDVAANISDPIRGMVDARAVMAPMSGVTDVPFRLIMRKFGCRFAFTEMIDVNGIVYNNRKTLSMLERPEKDSPLGVQIVGENKEKIIHAAKVCEGKGFDLIDLNVGCPAPKVIKGGKGVALLKDLRKLAGIVRKLVKSVKLPVTVKIRSGWDRENLNYLEAAKMIETEGASAICIHPRSREQQYKGKPDHDMIREIVEAVDIPVFASGNMFKPQDIEEVISLTGCDGVFIARGVLGKPWIFRQIEEYSSGEEYSWDPSFDELKRIIMEHVSLSLKYYEERLAFSRMYKHICWYLKKYKNLNEIMKEYVRAREWGSFLIFMDKLRLEGNRLVSED